MLERDPEKRFAMADDVQQALEATPEWQASANSGRAPSPDG
jgi:hypothetical protein